MTDEAVLAAQRHLWTIGDYPAVARHLLPISAETVEALGLRPGMTVLDVGMGDGNASIEAARLGATVTGVDLARVQVERARARASSEGVAIDAREGNAEALEFPDESFDVVMSVLGVIFAPDHAAAVSEMARVCRPGGRVAIAAWSEGGWAATWRQRMGDILPPAPRGGPQPDDWGDPVEVQRRFRAAGLDASVEVRPFTWRFPSAEAGIELLLSASGPFIMFMEAAIAVGRGEEAHAALVEVLQDANIETDGTCVSPAPYVLAIGRR